MKEKLREYRADDIKVTWSQMRCIHFAACVERLPAVFDTDQKPWIQPAKAEPEEVSEAVLRCPTGALHFRRADGANEEVADTNTVQVAPDGPLYLRGDIEIHDGKGEILLHDTRVALCRCGASAHGPLCDGSHKEVRALGMGANSVTCNSVRVEGGTGGSRSPPPRTAPWRCAAPSSF